RSPPPPHSYECGHGLSHQRTRTRPPRESPALENRARTGNNTVMTVSPSDAGLTHAAALLPLPPGPRGSWLLGNLGAFAREMLGFYTRCAALGDLVPYRLGYHRMCLVNHPDFVEQVLITDARNYSKITYVLNLLVPVLGRGLLTSEGD